VQTAIENTGVQGVIRLRAGYDVAYFLFRGGEALLIGAGKREHLPLFEATLKNNNLTWNNVRAVLLPNADPEAFACLPMVREKCAAKVYVHRLEEPRLAMRPVEKNSWNFRRMCDARRLKKYGNLPCAPDMYISGGDVLDMWYGLTVMDLPGYSSGNCGFYCRHLGIVFTGSLPIKPRICLRMYEKCFLDADILSASRARVIEKMPTAILES
jgi:glyoxylase-like metal-dependent hydrolase (beta-lactamase superfamily II)